MAKRFIDTELWQKEWFQDLSIENKLLLKFIFENCDCAGVWNSNYRLASFILGVPVNQDDIKKINEKKEQFEILSNGDIFVIDFIKFQYGTLSENCKPHKPVIEKLKKYNLFERVLKGYRKGFETLEEKEQEQYKEWLNMLPTVDVQVNYNTNTDPLELITINDEFMVLSYENFDSWDTINLPQYWESLPIFGEFDGVVWFVKEVQIPRSWLGKKLKLDLGPIDDRDVTFVNSICVGRHDKDSEYSIHRSYDVPAQYIKKTTIKIAVRVTDTHGHGGFAGNKFDMKLSTPDGDKISLAGKWKYKVTAELMDGYLHLFNMQNNQFATRPKPSTSLNQMFPTSLYNGMIEPIKRISFAGMVWYQGESNVEREDHLQYERLLKKFLPCMRETFNKPNMPIYVIQIAPWEYTGNDKLPGGLLRIAQYKATKDEPNTTLIPSIDLGSMTTAHPSKKWTLANRLTKSVLCNQYGFKHIDQVPVIKHAKTMGSLMTITFDNANQLFNDPDKPNLFEIADETMDFFSANVVVNDNEITVFSHLVSEPVVVRYASKNYVEPTLYNEIGLPAPSFEIYIPRTQQW